MGEHRLIFQLGVITRASRVSSCEVIIRARVRAWFAKKNMRVYKTGQERVNEFLLEVVKDPNLVCATTYRRPSFAVMLFFALAVMLFFALAEIFREKHSDISNKARTCRLSTI